ncbi:aminodeoxychorismate synthase component I [Campylobacter sp. 9BO]|uniref:aminodeoxychorismate synthase component I n=1 Tax=Campylobacter sp. 9BO TaxID=3424759 RepID=UPI003D34407F
MQDLKISQNIQNNGSAFVALYSYDEPERNIVCHPADAYKYGIKFAINQRGKGISKYEFKKFPPNFNEYKVAFENVQNAQLAGDSYLLNLCRKSKIKTNLSLDEIFKQATAKLVLHKKDEFVCFSPEPFVTIYKGFIHTFPMKGTINAHIPNAKQMLLSDIKELSEQAMITDLMRNDLSIVADNVRVRKFRYFTRAKELYQTSTYIKGKIRQEFCGKNGLKYDEIFASLLPAGSITGTPKYESMRIIAANEPDKRGFYTGVFVYFDGKICKSYVLIRFIKKQSDGLYFHSGGGITLDSDVVSEYNELTEKIYLPF